MDWSSVTLLANTVSYDVEGEGDLAEVLWVEPVGVAAELAEVGQPGVGALDRPAQAQGERLLDLGLALALLLGADEVGEPEVHGGNPVEGRWRLCFSFDDERGVVAVVGRFGDRHRRSSRWQVAG